MKIITILLLCAAITGCSGLILRDDDNMGQTVAKVATRTLLVIPTFGFLELGISKTKRREALAAKQADQDVYFGAQCTKEGVEPGTREFQGCILVKRQAMEGQLRP